MFSNPPHRSLVLKYAYIAKHTLLVLLAYWRVHTSVDTRKVVNFVAGGALFAGVRRLLKDVSFNSRHLFQVLLITV